MCLSDESAAKIVFFNATQRKEEVKEENASKKDLCFQLGKEK